MRYRVKDHNGWILAGPFRTLREAALARRSVYAAESYRVIWVSEMVEPGDAESDAEWRYVSEERYLAALEKGRPLRS